MKVTDIGAAYDPQFERVDMSDNLRAAALMAVDALDSDDPTIQLRAAISLRAALAEPAIKEFLTVEKPVAWMSDSDVGFYKEEFGNYPCVPLYTAPPRREWVGLTGDEINAIEFPESGTATMRDFVRIIEAKLREKNGG
jgi:hypothetical protein